MLVFDKSEVRNSLNLDNIFDLLQEWGGDPEYTSFGILCATICHNRPGDGSKKLYYYDNTGLFRCYTGCDSYFDIFELTVKIMRIQHDRDFDLNDAVRWIAQKFGLSGREEDDPDNDELEDWNFDLAWAYSNKREQEYLTEIENDPAFYGANHLEIVVPDKHWRG